MSVFEWLLYHADCNKYEAKIKFDYASKNITPDSLFHYLIKYRFCLHPAEIITSQKIKWKSHIDS